MGTVEGVENFLEIDGTVVDEKTIALIMCCMYSLQNNLQLEDGQSMKGRMEGTAVGLLN